MECGGSHDVRLEELGTHAGRICHAQKFFSSGRTVQEKKNNTHGGSKSNLFDMFSCRSAATVLNLFV